MVIERQVASVGVKGTEEGSEDEDENENEDEAEDDGGWGREGRLLARAFRAKVHDKGPEAGEAEGRVDVVLDDVKGEVVEAAEAPDTNDQQERDSERRLLQNEEGARKQAHQEEEGAFEFDPGGIREVFGQISELWHGTGFMAKSGYSGKVEAGQSGTWCKQRLGPHGLGNR